MENYRLQLNKIVFEINQWQVRKTKLIIVISLSADSVVSPDEKFRHIDPEGGYEDPDEGFRAELAAMTG
jgi:hypothetical protein